MLVPIPIGLWIGSLVCDLWHHLSPSPPAWLGTVAFVTMAGGVIGSAKECRLHRLLDHARASSEPWCPQKGRDRPG
jgi:hypothetical protein